MAYEYKLPSLGDGVTGKVTEIRVQPGQTVAKEDIVIVVGTDKVDAEMPIDVDGVVEEVLVKVGDDVTEGTPVLRIQVSHGAAAETPSPAPSTDGEKRIVAEKGDSGKAEIADNNSSQSAPAPAPAPEKPAPSLPKGHLRASPLARKRAKELGIELADITPAPGSERISYKDVLDYVKRKMDSAGGTAVATGAGIAHRPLPNFDKFGPTERQAQSRIGLITAENMVYAFNAIPHAWISEKADITRLEQLRQQYKEQVKAAGGNLTTTAILVKAVAVLLRKMPQFNASYDPEKREIVFKKFYNIGVAVDTPRGLLVPVIKNADQKNLTEISVELTELSARTRDGKNKIEDLEGGTFSISNIGGIGGTNMHSIVNWPEVAILSVTAARHEAVWNGSAFEPRLLMPMTIGWDHRVINGADAARFLQHLKAILEEPFLGLL
ncbi:MAG: 2-oxo acid dehydrogenase subunit E2 [Saprospiraceae bacterium]|nr:2-oxo acid dehydrogenase subunit E2 [Saprospiraceae bacterium]MDW8230224.1 2-oxo acid dehydrogenase subunit E2 [Saprospiraceae bacterium]